MKRIAANLGDAGVDPVSQPESKRLRTQRNDAVPPNGNAQLGGPTSTLLLGPHTIRKDIPGPKHNASGGFAPDYSAIEHQIRASNQHHSGFPANRISAPAQYFPWASRNVQPRTQPHSGPTAAYVSHPKSNPSAAHPPQSSQHQAKIAIQQQGRYIKEALAKRRKPRVITIGRINLLEAYQTKKYSGRYEDFVNDLVQEMKTQQLTRVAPSMQQTQKPQIQQIPMPRGTHVAQSVVPRIALSSQNPKRVSHYEARLGDRVSFHNRQYGINAPVSSVPDRAKNVPDQTSAIATHDPCTSAGPPFRNPSAQDTGQVNVLDFRTTPSRDIAQSVSQSRHMIPHGTNNTPVTSNQYTNQSINPTTSNHRNVHSNRQAQTLPLSILKLKRKSMDVRTPIELIAGLAVARQLLLNLEAAFAGRWPPEANITAGVDLLLQPVETDPDAVLTLLADALRRHPEEIDRRIGEVSKAVARAAMSRWRDKMCVLSHTLQYDKAFPAVLEEFLDGVPEDLWERPAAITLDDIALTAMFSVRNGARATR